MISPFNYGWAALGVVGIAIGSWVFGFNHGSTTTENRLELEKAEALAINVDAVNQQLIASRAQTEEIRKVFLDYKTGKENETSALERDVADGIKRLRVKATCAPAVPTTGTVPGGAGKGTAELEHAASELYFRIRREADRQYAELQFCRSELRKRSAK